MLLEQLLVTLGGSSVLTFSLGQKAHRSAIRSASRRQPPQQVDDHGRERRARDRLVTRRYGK